MFLDDRKKRILQAIIDDYIETAEPIGSRSIARKHEIGLSSATIRNEMADLEELGYITQPHTSAGRVPSDKGYRFYVDQIVKPSDVSRQEVDYIEKEFRTDISELTQLIKRASIAISKTTQYTSIATTPEVKKSVVKALQLVPIDSGNVLVVVVTNVGTYKSNVMRTPEDISSDVLIKISNILNGLIGGLFIGQINDSTLKNLEKLEGLSDEILLLIIGKVVECIRQIHSAEVFFNGATNILNYPEFRDIQKAQEILNILDSRETLIELLNGRDEEQMNILIGKEVEIEGIDNCSVITTSYSFGDIAIGSIGIIGPKRMAYSRVISSISYIKRKINEEIIKLLCGILVTFLIQII